MNARCLLCGLPEERIWFEFTHSLAVLDSFPVTEGHARVIPKRHVVNAFDLLSVAAENIAKAKVTV